MFATNPESGDDEGSDEYESCCSCIDPQQLPLLPAVCAWMTIGRPRKRKKMTAAQP
jgi:hypothetical protein